MPYAKPDNVIAPMTKWGRREATVFSGFCSYHDKSLFQPIEDKEFAATEEQIFLFIYRAFAREYHRKCEMVKFHQNLFSRKPSLVSLPKEENLGYAMGLALRDLDVDKEVFDKAIIEKDFSCLTYTVWEIDSTCKFAASGLEAPTFDIRLKHIQDLTKENQPAKYIYYSVFPQEDKEICIIAWLKHNDVFFADYKKQLCSLDNDQRKNYINNTLPIISENIVLNPTAWDALPQYKQDEFNALFAGIDVLALLSGEPNSRLEPASYNLFSL